MGNVYRTARCGILSEVSEVREGGMVVWMYIGDYHIISTIYYRFVCMDFG